MEPQILFNPKAETVEFMHNHVVYVFRPGEKRLLDSAVADHALKRARVGLEVYDGTGDRADIGDISGDIDYEAMPWRKVVAMASKRGVFKPGMKKKDVFKLMRELDAQGN